MQTNSKPLKLALLLLLSTTITASLTTSTQVQASGWHSGTPKALRGYWSIKQKESTRYTIIGSKTFTNATTTSGASYLTNLHYRFLGHHRYQLRGHRIVFSEDTGLKSFYIKGTNRHHKLGVKNSMGAKNRNVYNYFTYRHH